ncbi:hypothetical protein TNCT_485741 [Trichonephila clavata]|uniref:Uncharacterized protein n=1 Tax=Trichonephila clavata TaxID=2740835 RepID=A0A8X6F4M6_TRICU|nr:hypothetical protein TNCT_485741 [Trichonephila clavata]
MSSSSDSEECMEAHSPAHAPPPPRLDEIKKNLSRAHNATDCMDFCVLLDNVIQGIDTYGFQTTTEKNEFSYTAYNLQEEVRSLYFSLKKTEMDMETHDDLLKQWGTLTEKEIAEFVPVVNKKQKSRPLSPVIDTSSAKKKNQGRIRTSSRSLQSTTCLRSNRTIRQKTKWRFPVGAHLQCRKSDHLHPSL